MTVGTSAGRSQPFLTKLRLLFSGQPAQPRRKTATPRVERRQNGARKRSYEAVAVRPAPRACKEARSLAGKRFLVAEAPKLPLSTCTQRCTCAYESFPDRRDETRRAIDVGISSSWYVGPERRSGLDRRGTGPADGNPSYYDFRRDT